MVRAKSSKAYKAKKRPSIFFTTFTPGNFIYEYFLQRLTERPCKNNEFRVKPVIRSEGTHLIENFDKDCLPYTGKQKGNFFLYRRTCYGSVLLAPPFSHKKVEAPSNACVSHYLHRFFAAALKNYGNRCVCAGGSMSQSLKMTPKTSFYAHQKQV